VIRLAKFVEIFLLKFNRPLQFILYFDYNKSYFFDLYIGLL